MVDPGSVVVTIDRWTLAEELWLYGEDALYLAPLAMGDCDLLRVWLLGGTALMTGRARSGSEAAALAAVELLEGRERPLARNRRRPRSGLPDLGRAPENRLADVHRIQKACAFPHPWD